MCNARVSKVQPEGQIWPSESYHLGFIKAQCCLWVSELTNKHYGLTCYMQHPLWPLWDFITHSTHSSMHWLYARSSGTCWSGCCLQCDPAAPEQGPHTAWICSNWIQHVRSVCGSDLLPHPSQFPGEGKC